jgi:hypothetical protein
MKRGRQPCIIQKKDKNRFLAGHMMHLRYPVNTGVPVIECTGGRRKIPVHGIKFPISGHPIFIQRK